ncbi:MAG: iron-sulfur cluster-binding domain-containing protein [Spirochaetota bacterium]
MKIVTIHGPIRDTLSFVAHLRLRNRHFKAASASTLPVGAMNLLASALHPSALTLRVATVREETALVRTYRFVPALEGTSLPSFRAGQYLSIGDTINGVNAERPYSISCTPDESAAGNYYEITVKRKEDGFFSARILDTWKPGCTVRSSGPLGTFYYEPLRDGPELVCLAGGTGITPFRSIIGDALAHTDARFTLFFGVACPDELLFMRAFEALADHHPDRFRIMTVCADADDKWDGEKGFLSAALIRKNIPSIKGSCFFICGPEGLKRYFDDESRDWGLAPRQVRTENYGGGETLAKDIPLAIEVRRDGETSTISADPAETILMALERAGLEPPSLCRSGDCGWCRSRLLEGEILVRPGANGVRMADGKFGYFHPCITYPKSPIIMRVSRNPAG